jgi:hypothetical protein
VNTYTTSQQRLPVVAPRRSGGFVVVWQDYQWDGISAPTNGVRGRLFDDAGTAVGGEFQVTPDTTTGESGPAIGSDGADGFVVVWSRVQVRGSSLSNVWARLYDDMGVPVGGEFQVNTDTAGAQTSAAVGRDGAEGFVVVWESDRGTREDTSGTSIRGQRYDGSGAVIGGEFEVNTYTTGHQSQPGVAAAGTAGFVVVWRSDGSPGTDTSESSIQGQRYSSAGVPVGSEFQVNTYTTDSQFEPVVGPDGIGDFVVAWNSLGSYGTDTSGSSVQAQRFEGALASELPVGTKLVLRDRPSKPQKRALVLVAKDVTLTLGTGNHDTDDPVLHGGSLRVMSRTGDGFDTTYDLPAARWRYRGRAGANRGYALKRAKPIRMMVVRAGRLVKVKAKGGELGHVLGSNPEPVHVVLQLGGRHWCWTFGGAVTFAPDKTFVAKGAPVAAACP